MSPPISALTATELLDHYSRGALSPVTVIQASLDRARAVQPALNIFTLLDDESALRQADESAKRWEAGRPIGIFDGVPVAVKDTAMVKGWRTGFGSLSSANAGPAEEDSPIVQRLREEGAIFIGKTTAPEFAWKGVTDSVAQGITRNPWNPAMTPGGSSGGSAAAVAVGVVPVATGADGAGSLRIPASFSGIVGLKTTAFLVPNTPTPLGAMAVVGGLTRTVRDQAMLMKAIVKPDHRDSFAVPYEAPDYLAALQSSLAGVRIGLSLSLGFQQPTDEIRQVVETCASRLRELGAIVETVDLRLDDTLEAFEVLWALAFSEILQRLPEAALAQVELALLALHEKVPSISGWDAQAAQRTVRQVTTRMASFFEKHDALLTPTMPILPFEAGRLAPGEDASGHWWNWSPYTWPFNLSRNPAVSCPGGLSAGGLPIGVQFVGPQFGEARLLQLAQALEGSVGLTGAMTEWSPGTQ